MNDPLVIGDAVLYNADCLEVMPRLEAGSFDAVVTDPPYGLGFMGKEWDKPGAFVERKPDRRNRFDHVGGNHNPTSGEDAARTRRVEGQKAQTWHQRWATECLRVTAPGGFLLAFGGTRTFHRLACAVEDAGWEITDTLMWVYGSGFPKGRSCLKPAWEPVILARRPAPRVRLLGVDECRVEGASWQRSTTNKHDFRGGRLHAGSSAEGRRIDCAPQEMPSGGRWPANVVHDGSDEVLEAFAAFGEKATPAPYVRTAAATNNVYGAGAGFKPAEHEQMGYGDTGTAARFFYTAKADKEERNGSNHPTVKPLDLMRWLVRLVVPRGGVCLDPFGGSMTTVMAALREGRRCVAVEREVAYFGQGAERVRGFYGEAAGDLFARGD